MANWLAELTVGLVSDSSGLKKGFSDTSKAAKKWSADMDQTVRIASNGALAAMGTLAWFANKQLTTLRDFSQEVTENGLAAAKKVKEFKHLSFVTAGEVETIKEFNAALDKLIALPKQIVSKELLKSMPALTFAFNNFTESIDILTKALRPFTSIMRQFEERTGLAANPFSGLGMLRNLQNVQGRIERSNMGQPAFSEFPN
jgi:hypothetical protein